MAQSNIIKLTSIVALLALGFYASQHLLSKSETGPVDHSAHLGTSGESTMTATSGPAIGGDFTLTDQEGKPFSSTQLDGRYSLVFFGFTHCPDVCPLAMTSLTEALSELPAEQSAQITPVFITIDPERDTPAVIKEYLANFFPGFVGLTGTHAEIKQAASAYRVYYTTAHPEDKDYQVAHSGYIYFMSPDGKYIRHFSHDDSAEKIASALHMVLGHQGGEGETHHGAHH